MKKVFLMSLFGVMNLDSSLKAEMNLGLVFAVFGATVCSGFEYLKSLTEEKDKETDTVAQNFYDNLNKLQLSEERAKELTQVIEKKSAEDRYLQHLQDRRNSEKTRLEKIRLREEKYFERLKNLEYNNRLQTLTTIEELQSVENL